MTGKRRRKAYQRSTWDLSDVCATDAAEFCEVVMRVAASRPSPFSRVPFSDREDAVMDFIEMMLRTERWRLYNGTAPLEAFVVRYAAGFARWRMLDLAKARRRFGARLTDRAGSAKSDCREAAARVMRMLPDSFGPVVTAWVMSGGSREGTAAALGWTSPSATNRVSVRMSQARRHFRERGVSRASVSESR